MQHAGGLIGQMLFFTSNDQKRNTAARKTSFLNAKVRNVYVSGAPNRTIISDVLLFEIDVYDLDYNWFQNNEATCHTACEALNLFEYYFEKQLIYVQDR